MYVQVSIVTEMFLDLSLPVSDEVMTSDYVRLFRTHFHVFLQAFFITPQAYRKKNQKKVQISSESTKESRGSPTLTNGNDVMLSGSKYQQKKAKKQAKKQAKVKWV